jgi:hypothetical protein
MNSVWTRGWRNVTYYESPKTNEKYVLRINYESSQQDATIQVSLLFLVNSTCFGRCFRLSSGAPFVFTLSGIIHLIAARQPAAT